MITGGMKFFELSKSLLKNGVQISTSSNQVLAKYALSPNLDYLWTSESGSDFVTEIISISFPSLVTINRLLLRKLNWKSFRITHSHGEEFSVPINVTEWDQDSFYFEFDNVTLSSIDIEIYTTQTADAIKYLGEVVATNEIGTLDLHPTISIDFNNNEIVTKLLSGLKRSTPQKQTATLKIDYKLCPSQNDITLLEDLFDFGEAVLCWPCGGKYGSDSFKYQVKGWRLKDIFQMSPKGKLSSDWYKSFLGGIKRDLTFEESI